MGEDAFEVSNITLRPSDCRPGRCQSLPTDVGRRL